MNYSLKKKLGISAYIFFVLLPIYWLLNMSFKSNAEILGELTFWPKDFTLDNYAVIFSDPSWYMGYVNSMAYVSLNVIITLMVALPAAYAFSRYKFAGDKQLFFWLLTNRMAPPAVFLLPFFQLYSSVGCLIPIWRWRWRTVCLTCRWRYGFWKVLCPAYRGRSMKPLISTVTAFTVSLSRFSCR